MCLYSRMLTVWSRWHVQGDLVIMTSCGPNSIKLFSIDAAMPSSQGCSHWSLLKLTFIPLGLYFNCIGTRKLDRIGLYDGHVLSSGSEALCTKKQTRSGDASLSWLWLPRGNWGNKMNLVLDLARLFLKLLFANGWNCKINCFLKCLRVYFG